MTRRTALLALTTALTLSGGTSAWTRQALVPPAPPQSPVEFDVIARQFEFSPSRLEVAQGDHVRIRVHSEDKDHGFSIPKLKVDHLLPASGKVVTIEFDAKTAGAFDIVCSEACGTGHKNMKGTLVVVASGKDTP